jgi:hypothetical protein
MFERENSFAHHKANKELVKSKLLLGHQISSIPEDESYDEESRGL